VLVEQPEDQRVTRVEVVDVKFLVPHRFRVFHSLRLYPCAFSFTFDLDFAIRVRLPKSTSTHNLDFEVRRMVLVDGFEFPMLVRTVAKLGVGTNVMMDGMMPWLILAGEEPST